MFKTKTKRVKKLKIERVELPEAVRHVVIDDGAGKKFVVKDRYTGEIVDLRNWEEVLDKCAPGSGVISEKAAGQYDTLLHSFILYDGFPQKNIIWQWTPNDIVEIWRHDHAVSAAKLDDKMQDTVYQFLHIKGTRFTDEMACEILRQYANSPKANLMTAREPKDFTVINEIRAEATKEYQALRISKYGKREIAIPSGITMSAKTQKVLDLEQELLKRYLALIPTSDWPKNQVSLDLQNDKLRTIGLLVPMYLTIMHGRGRQTYLGVMQLHAHKFPHGVWRADIFTNWMPSHIRNRHKPELIAAGHTGKERKDGKIGLGANLSLVDMATYKKEFRKEFQHELTVVLQWLFKHVEAAVKAQETYASLLVSGQAPALKPLEMSA